MQIGFFDQRNLDILSKKAGSALGLGPDVLAQVSKGNWIATAEILSFLHRLSPHKKKILIESHLSPFLGQLSSQLSSEGFEIHEVKSENALEAFAGKESEILCFVYAGDAPVLGVKRGPLPWRTDLEKRRVPRVGVWHNPQAFMTSVPRDPQEIGKYSYHCVAISTDFAVLVHSVKVKPHLPLSHLSEWSENLLGNIHLSDLAENRNAVETFEKSKPSDAIPILQNWSGERVWDRVVLGWEDMDGHALIDSLAKSYGRELLPPGQDPWFETLSLSRWGGLKVFQNLIGALHISENQARGCVVIDLELVQKDLADRIKDCRKKILNLQGTR